MIELEDLMTSLSNQSGFQFSFEVLLDDEITVNDFRSQKFEIIDPYSKSLETVFKEIEGTAQIPLKIIKSSRMENFVCIVHQPLIDMDDYVLDIELENFEITGNRFQIVNELNKKGINLLVSSGGVIGSDDFAEQYKKIITINEESLKIRDIIIKFFSEFKSVGRCTYYATTSQNKLGETTVFLSGEWY